MSRNKPIDKILLSLAVVAAVGATVCAVRFASGMSTLIVVPLYISTSIVLLQSRVNRFAFILGAVNALLYGAVYIYDTLYLTAAYAILFSCPFQLLTFVRWKKKDNDGETVFKAMSCKTRLLVACGFLLCFAVFYAVTRYLGSRYGIYDTITMLLGILVTLLCAGPYVEYAPLQTVLAIIGLPMFAKMARAEPIQYAYLIYQTYSVICIIVATVRVFRIYNKQSFHAARIAYGAPGE